MNNIKADISEFDSVGVWDADETRLPVAVYVISKGETNLPARIYISNEKEFNIDNCFGLTVNDNPVIIGNRKLSDDDMESVMDWMFLNWSHLLKVWEGDMENHQIEDGFEKI